MALTVEPSELLLLIIESASHRILKGGHPMAVKKKARKKARKKKPVSAAVKKKAAKKKAPRKAKKKSHKVRLKTRPLRQRPRGLRELREGIPQLDIRDNGDLNEAVPTADAYQPATGDVKAVMVF